MRIAGVFLLLAQEIQLPVTVAQDPTSRVALGVGRVLDEPELLKKVAILPRDEGGGKRARGQAT